MEDYGKVLIDSLQNNICKIVAEQSNACLINEEEVGDFITENSPYKQGNTLSFFQKHFHARRLLLRIFL